MPIKKLRILFLIKGVIVPPTSLALFLWAAIVTHGGGPLVTGHAKITSSYMNTAYSAVSGLNAIIGLFSSMAVNFPDFSRFSKNNLKGYNQFFALPIIGTLGALTPIFVTSAHSYLWGDFQWYMPAVIAKFDSRAAKFFTAFSFMLATIGNQIAAGTYPFSNDSECLLFLLMIEADSMTSLRSLPEVRQHIPCHLDHFGILCGLQPMADYKKCLRPAGFLVWLQHVHGGHLRNHVLPLLPHRSQEAQHPRDVQWQRHLSLLQSRHQLESIHILHCRCCPLLPGFSKSINNSLDVGGLWKIYTFSCLYGFFVSGVVYYVICKYISGVGAAEIEEAVYPPQKINVRDVEVGVAGSEDESIQDKSGVAVLVGQKELS